MRSLNPCTNHTSALSASNAELEERLTSEANEMGIGPMGFGGATTILDTKIVGLSRLPASYFVSVSYMCWAYRRRKMTVKGEEVIYD
jgi:fumarate hydratase class I